MEKRVYQMNRPTKKQLEAQKSRWSEIPRFYLNWRQKQKKKDYGIYFYLIAVMARV